MATNKDNTIMAKSDSRSSLNFLSDDSDIYDNANENAILAADSPLRNPPTTSAVVEKTKHKKHSLSSRFLADKAKKTATTADSTKQKKRKKRLAKSLKKAKQKLTEKHLNLFPEGVSLQPLPKVSCTDNDNMESEDLIPGTPESQQGIINNFERSHFSAVNDLQAFIAKHKLKSNAAEELMRIFTRLVESFDMSAINKRIDTIEEKVGISATPPAQPVKTKTYASTAQQWSQGLLPTPKTTTIKPKITGPPKTLPPKQKTPQPVNVQKAAGKTDFVSLPTVLVVPKTSDPMEEVVKEKINIKPLLEANISPKALGIRIITCRVTSSNNTLVTVQTQDMANKLMAAINQHANLQQIYAIRPKQWFLVGDGNIQSGLWGPDRDDIKRKRDFGGPMIDFILFQNLLVWNDPTAGPTFQTNNGRSWIDVTLSTSSLYDRKDSWQLERSTLSDHSYILFSLASQVFSPPKQLHISKRKLKQLAITIENYYRTHLDTVQKLNSKSEVDDFITHLTSLIHNPDLYEPTLNPYEQHPSEWATYPFGKTPPSGNDIEIYTDGSKIDNKVGSAIACTTLNQNLSISTRTGWKTTPPFSKPKPMLYTWHLILL
ncbi:hypothetical protein HNY73_003324 [Argiope bruennichi]|uniref:Endonuclease/exonuclease/phosphatase domain-containing protein n=1 Tax=Argiope bruennichi TaxID=94029 RepID=A0A8T0G0J3_ARGBR|nr:hypothetical protein HNY73_003324 [Argiope bruennichi]